MEVNVTYACVLRIIHDFKINLAKGRETLGVAICREPPSGARLRNAVIYPDGSFCKRVLASRCAP